MGVLEEQTTIRASGNKPHEKPARPAQAAMCLHRTRAANARLYAQTPSKTRAIQ
jgi:hypothetical protein